MLLINHSESIPASRTPSSTGKHNTEEPNSVASEARLSYQYLMRATSMDGCAQAEESCIVQGQFRAALKDVVEAVNARHSMSRAIAAYTSLQSSALQPCRSSSSAAEQQQDCTAGYGSTEARAQQEDLKGGRRGGKPQQDKADNTADTLSEESEQTTDITDVACRTPGTSVAQ